jgi:hypothetical protein
MSSLNPPSYKTRNWPAYNEALSHTAHRLQTTLAPAHEAVAIALRKTLLVSLDDLLAMVRVVECPKLCV